MLHYLVYNADGNLLNYWDQNKNKYNGIYCLLELMEEFNLYIHRDIYIHIYVIYINIVLHNVYLMLTDIQFYKFLVLSCKCFFLNQTSVQVSISSLLWKK
jgi:hypothetical protein